MGTRERVGGVNSRELWEDEAGDEWMLESDFVRTNLSMG